MILFNKLLSALLASLTVVSAAHACDLHGGGNLGFGFNRLHPLAQQHYQASAFKTLSVKHAKQVYNLTFTVKRPGQSHISIQINGLSDGKPFSLSQKIELRSA